MTCPGPARPVPSDMVAAWRRYDEAEQRLSAHVSERMLDLAGVRQGSRVLDIATGRGEPAVRAAARVAPGGGVIGTDISADMLDFARARAAAAGVTLDLRVTDGETLAAVTERDFDAALCRWGIMFFAQPRASLAAIRQRLRPGAPFVAAVWGAPAQVSWWALPREVLARHARLPPLDLAQPGPFRHAAPETLRADLAAAGFELEHEEDLGTAVMETATIEGVIDWCLAFGLACLLADQPAAVDDAWRRDMAEAAQRHRDADGMFRLGGVTRLVVARVPA